MIPKLQEAEYDIVLIDNLSQSVYVPEFHANCTFYETDIRNYDDMKYIFEYEKPDVVFHFAGLVSIYDCNKDTYSAADNNIMGTINILNATLESGCKRVIFSESSAVYENCNLELTGYHESQSDPCTFYAASKAACALIAKSYARTKGLNYTALRYFNVAGPIQDYKRTVPPLFAGVALRLIGGNNPIIFGDGTRRRDFIHVDDVNDFHMMCINNPKISGTFNLGLGKSTSLFEICEIIHKYLKIDKVLEFDIMPEINGEAHTIYADNSKAQKLGWIPKKTINDAIYDTVEYLKLEIEKGNINPKTFMSNININNIKI